MEFFIRIAPEMAKIFIWRYYILYNWSMADTHLTKKNVKLIILNKITHDKTFARFVWTHSEILIKLIVVFIRSPMDIRANLIKSIGVWRLVNLMDECHRSICIYIKLGVSGWFLCLSFDVCVFVCVSFCGSTFITKCLSHHIDQEPDENHHMNICTLGQSPHIDWTTKERLCVVTDRVKRTSHQPASIE